jgi:acyl-CoA reductase-like NAD-dependent aldehyde dehydrogenase
VRLHHRPFDQVVAFRSWSRLSARQRGDLLRKVADTLEARSRR